ncbi:MAG: hypothetical protein LIO46_05830, partial [Clostridiales bacterium]|nr:hypothetical protein [Clostridiales bacterium]
MAEEEKSLGEWFKELGEFLEDAAWLESIAPIVDLLSPESINGFFKTDFNKSGTWGEIFTGFDTGFSLLQAAGGFGKILQGAFNKDLTDREGDMLIAAGITDMGAGISGALEALLKSTKKYPNAVQGLNTAGSLFGGLAGVFDSYRAIKELANADTAEKRAGAGCELAAGILDTAAAYCELSGHKEFAVPIKVLAASFKIAARFFQEGKWGLGILTIAIGAAIAGALYVGFEAVKNAIIAALTSLLAPLSIN